MSKRDEEGFVANGYERLYEASREKIAEIERRVRAKYAEALAAAGLVERLRIELQIRKEVKAEVDKLVPPDGMY